MASNSRARRWMRTVIILSLNLLIFFVISSNMVFLQLSVGLVMIPMIIILGIKFYRFMSIQIHPTIQSTSDTMISEVMNISALDKKDVILRLFRKNLRRSQEITDQVIDKINDLMRDSDQLDKQAMKIELRRIIDQEKGIQAVPKSKSSLNDLIRISLKYLKINKKYLMISLVGLFLSVLILSQSYLLVDSYEQDHFNRYLEKKDNTAYKITVENMNLDLVDEYQQYMNAQIGKWSQYQGLNINNLDIYGGVKFKAVMGRQFNLDIRLVWVDTVSIQTSYWSPSLYELLNQFPTFPDIEYNSSETLLILSPFLSRSSSVGTTFYSADDFISNGSLQVLMDEPEKRGLYNATSLPSFTNYSLPMHSIDHVWEVTTNDLNYNKEQGGILNSELLHGTYLMPKTSTWDYYAELVNVTPADNHFIWGSMGVESQMTIDLPPLNEMPLPQLTSALAASVSRIRQDQNDFFSFFGNVYNFLPRIRSPLKQRIDAYDNDTIFMRVIIPASLIPLILVSLFLLYFSLNLIERWKAKIFIILKQRGASFQHMRLLLITEVFAIGTMAVILGMFAAIPVTSLLLRSSGFLEFYGSKINVLIPKVWFYKVPIISILLVFNLYISNILNVEEINILEGFSLKNIPDPIWKRLNLDLIGLIIGLLFWIVIPELDLGEFNVAIYVFFGSLSLIFIIFAFPLSISRYFVDIFSFLFRQVFDRLELLRLIVMNMRSRYNFTTQLVAVLILSIMLSSMAMVFPTTSESIIQERALYDTGSEIRIDNIDYHHPNLSLLDSIDGVESYTEVLKSDFIAQGREKDKLSIKFLGIDPTTFRSAAYWSDDFASENLEVLLDGFTRDDILLEVGMQKSLDLLIGDDYTFTYGNDFLKYLNLKGVYDYFPNHYYQPGDGSKQTPITMVVSQSTLLEIANITTSQIKSSVYIKSRQEFNLNDVTKAISRIFSSEETVSVYSYQDLAGSIDDESQNVFLVTIMHIILLVGLIINITAISFNNVIAIRDRGQEIAVFRALGMVRRQLAFILFTEIMVIISLSLIAGIFSGIFITRTIFIILHQFNFYEYPVPIHLSVSLESFLILASSQLLLSLIVVLYPIFSLSRQQTGNILRAT